MVACFLACTRTRAKILWVACLTYVLAKRILCLQQSREKLPCSDLKRFDVCFALPHKGQAGTGSRLKKYGPSQWIDQLLLNGHKKRACRVSC